MADAFIFFKRSNVLNVSVSFNQEFSGKIIMDRITLLSVLMIWIIVMSLTTEHRANASCVRHGNKRVLARRCNGRKRGKAVDTEFLKDQLSSMESVR